MSQFSTSSFVDHMLDELEGDEQDHPYAIADLQSPVTISTMELPSPALSATTSSAVDSNAHKNTDNSANKDSGNNATKDTAKGSWIWRWAEKRTGPKDIVRIH
ncbi:hypothetical protein BGX30_008101, partial [Mortierella sp. GBA39]